jgi:hypothetical protein
MPELTTSQAVRAFEVHPNVLARLILMGRVKARKNADGHWMISKESLERWNRQRVRRAPKPEQAAIDVTAGANAAKRSHEPLEIRTDSMMHGRGKALR